MFTAAVLAAFITGCGPDGIFGGGGSTTPPGGSTTIIPGATCTAASGPTIPTATSSNPTSGNQVATTSTSGVANSGKRVTVTFDRAMNPATLNSPATTFSLRETLSSAAVPGSVSMNGANTVATLTTAAALTPDLSYTATVTQAAASASGVAMGCVYEWSFRTVTPATVGPAPVNLGLAAPFAIAAAAGVTNDFATPPNTTINGNVALDPTATCNAVAIDAAGGFGLCGGLPPTLNGVVNSPLFPDAGVTSGAIKADLNAAYLSITPANLPGAIVLGCGTIGTGGGAGAGTGCAGNATLPSGVYISATASTIGVTGVLTLDGQGDSNAQFVFQVPSALTTAAGAPGVPGSEIILINGARASNVWWQVGSSATIGTYAVFQGNVLADTTITMGDQSTSCGRLLAGAVTASGQFTFDGNVVSVPGNSNAPASCQ